MTFVGDPATWDKSVPPPPCKIEGSPEEQAFNHAKGFIFNVYGAMDAGSHGGIPFRNESIVAFQKGAADRYKGPSLLPRLQQMHKGQSRDLSGLAVQIFPNNTMFCLVAGDMMTQASVQQSQQIGAEIRHRFADFFLIASDGQGPFVSNAVLRELDEDCGAPLPGAVQGDAAVQKADEVAQQFAQYFYLHLDDPAKRGGLNDLFKDVSSVTVGRDLFKSKMHIAHKLHFLPRLMNPTARSIQGIDAQPSPAGGFFVFVHGVLQLQDEERQTRFIDVFHLMPEGGAFWVTNMIMMVHGGV